MGQFGSLNKELAEFGPRGFNIIAITGENREKVLKHTVQVNPTTPEFKIGSGSGGGLQGNGKIPYWFLVAADGKVVGQGNGSPPKKMIEEELKKVAPATPERNEARAAKALAYAEELVAKKYYVQAMEVLDGVVKNKAQAGTESGKKAAARKAEIAKDEAARDEIALQKEIVAVVGGTERPAEKMKGKERDSAATRLGIIEKKATEKGATGAAELAKFWGKVMAEDYAR